jgi:hypothetical protein
MVTQAEINSNVQVKQNSSYLMKCPYPDCPYWSFGKKSANPEDDKCPKHKVPPEVLKEILN